MPFVSFASLKEYMEQLLPKLGLSQADAAVMSQIYIDTTKRGMGHHDINMLPMRLKALRSGAIRLSSARPQTGWGAPSISPTGTRTKSICETQKM